MKRRDDPRHEARVEALKTLFEKSFRSQTSLEAGSVAEQVFKNRQKIDRLIKKTAPAWPINQIAPLDLNILRLATWELLYKDKKEPYKAIVDEAVEIAKEYGSDTSAGFVNGVLGSIIKENIRVNKL